MNPYVVLAGFLFKVIGQILDLHAQNKLTPEAKDAIINNLHQVQ